MSVGTLIVCASLAAVASAHAGIAIYSNTDNVVATGRPVPVPLYLAQVSGSPTLNLVSVSGGGALESITFSAVHREVGFSLPPIQTSATVFLFTDEGDSDPDDDDNGQADADRLLWQSAPIALPPLASLERILQTIDVSGQNIAVADGASLWIGVAFGHDRLGQVVYSPPATGSTGGLLWSGTGFTQLTSSQGVGFAMTIPAPASAALLSAGVLVAARRRRRA